MCVCVGGRSTKRLGDINAFVTSTRGLQVWVSDAGVPYFTGTDRDCFISVVPRGSWAESAKLTFFVVV